MDILTRSTGGLIFRALCPFTFRVFRSLFVDVPAVLFPLVQKISVVSFLNKPVAFTAAIHKRVDKIRGVPFPLRDLGNNIY